MKRVWISFIAVIVSAAVSSSDLAGWDATASHDRASLDAFVGSHAGKTAAPPFAFVYGGKALSGLVGKWKVTLDEKAEGAKTVRTAVYSDPSIGFRVTVVYTIFHDYPVIEWVVRLKNEGVADTPIIENVQACAVSFPEFAAGPGPVMLYRALGSNAERTDFAPVTDTLAEKAVVRFGPAGGRSSDTNALPFFNIASAGRGIVVAIGWSGSWQAVIGRRNPRALDLTAGMAATHFKLHPGEEVRTPSAALLFWKGADRMSGHNLFRRFVLAHHTPQVQGKPISLPINHGVGFGGPFPCNEYVCATESYAIGMIDRLHQFGIVPDACWIDAGWYENATRNWWQGVGNWVVNKANFPRGLKPVTEAAKKYGQGFVVWFEPERVYEGTRLDREHADWLTKLPGNRNRLLDLGNPKALAWLTDHISNFIRDEGVTIYRQDFNFDPAPYWKAMDAPDRVGIAEMKYTEGLYAYWDALLARNPGLLIDNCASGGRRIDLETIGRSIPLWRTDYQ
jgi:alpha-galactosidase